MFEKIKEILVKELKKSPELITPESRLSEDLNIDSIDAVELVMEIEQKYDIEVQEEELQKTKTVQDLVTYIEKLISEK